MAQALLRLSEDEDAGELLTTGPSNQKTRSFRVIEVQPTEGQAIPLDETRRFKAPDIRSDNGALTLIESSRVARATFGDEFGDFESSEIEALLLNLGGMILLNEFPRYLAESKGLLLLSGNAKARLEIELQRLANKGRISCSQGYIRLIQPN
jgi:hypothetical protein